MNELSWMLYFASVCENLSNIFCIIFMAALITLVVSLFAGLIMVDNGCEKPTWTKWRGFLYGSVSVMFVTFIVSSVIPSKNTVYAIAASQMGEQALNKQIAINKSDNK